MKRSVYIKAKEILTYLSKYGEAGPTEIGIWMGYEYNSASSKLTHTIKVMVDMGLIERLVNGRYCLKKNFFQKWNKISDECRLKIK